MALSDPSASNVFVMDDLDIVNTPEPRSAALVVLGIALVMFGRLRFRSGRCAWLRGVWPRAAKRRAIRAGLVALLLSAGSVASWAAPTIGQMAALPSVITVNTGTNVTVSTLITDPSLIPGSVNLLQVDNAGHSTVIGVLNDAGLFGDEVAGDGVYSVAVPFKQTTPGTITLKISAAFRGLLSRVQSGALALNVSASPPAATFSGLCEFKRLPYSSWI